MQFFFLAKIICHRHRAKLPLTFCPLQASLNCVHPSPALIRINIRTFCFHVLKIVIGTFINHWMVVVDPKMVSVDIEFCPKYST